MTGITMLSRPLLTEEASAGTGGLMFEFKVATMLFAPRPSSPCSTPVGAVRASSYTVDRLPIRAVALHGVTGAELRRFNGACHQMQRATRSQGELWWLTTPKGSTRHEIAAYQKRITREQAACGLPQYSVWIFETRPELHAHIVFVGNRSVADTLRRSRLCIAAKRSSPSPTSGVSKRR